MTAVHIAADAAASGLDAALAAVLSAPLPDIATEDCAPGIGLLLGAFLRPHLHGLHPFLVEADLPAAVDVTDVLPEGAQVLRLHRRNTCTEVLAVVDGCLVVVRSWKRSADLWVSGPDRQQVDRLTADVAGRVPARPMERSVRVTFWQFGRGRWARSRDIDVPTWDEVRHLYPSTVRDALANLVDYRPQSTATGGRLLVWHGPPGTGKTTAVRALFDAWRNWADPHVVADPERLLNDGDYMAQVLLDANDEDAAERWRLVVVEDAEELLRRDARRQVGAALGRLLNTADGLLGQGSNALVLLTTNEPVDDMHPALLRPGRCLARIEFPAFESAEAAKLVGSPVAGPLTLAQIFELRGNINRLHVVAASTAPGQYL